MKLKKLVRQRWAAYTIATCSAVVLYLALSNLMIFLNWIASLWTIVSPVVIGLIIAYLINPVSNYFERTIFGKIKKSESRHTCSVILSIGCVLVLVTLFIVAIVPALTNSITGIINNYDVYYKNIQNLINSVNQFGAQFKIEIPQISEYANQLVSTLFGGLKDNLGDIMSKIGNIGSSIFNIIIGFIIAVYFLMSKNNLRQATDRFRRALMSEEKRKRENRFWSKCHEIFIQYIGCSLLDAFIIGISNSIFMLIFHMQNIVLVSMVVGITNLLPTFGPLIGGVLGAFLLLLTNPAHALYFIIFTAILQAIDGYVIKPKLFSNSLGLSPVLTLISIILGGKMFGIIGILLAIPVVAVLALLYEKELLPFLMKRRQAKEREESGDSGEAPASDEPETEEEKEAVVVS